MYTYVLRGIAYVWVGSSGNDQGEWPTYIENGLHLSKAYGTCVRRNGL